MAAVDRRSAIVSVHGVKFSGRIAWLMWLVVHITFLTGFKNRLSALINWLFSFVGTACGERAIVPKLDELLAHAEQDRRGCDAANRSLQQQPAARSPMSHPFQENGGRR